MKYGHLDRYRVTLEVRTPLFIGNGEKLRQYEYIVYQNHWLIPSMPLLVEKLASKNLLGDFERYLSDPKKLMSQKLGTWLNAHGIPVTPTADWVLYAMDSVVSQGNDLACFIKLPDGRPYIPGSSIKGVLRSVYIADKMNAAQAARILSDADKQPKEKKSGQEENIPRTLNYENTKSNNAKQNDAINDVLKGLQVSDSTPFGRNSLMVCQVTDAMNDSKGAVKVNDMPLFRECLKPGEKATFWLTIDRNILPDLTIDELKRMLTDTVKVGNEYSRMFSLSNLNIKKTSVKAGNVLLTIGAGTGFQSKSLILRAAKLTGVNGTPVAHRVLRAQFPNRHNGKGFYKPPCGDNSPAPYCRKFALLNGEYHPFGRCELTFEADN